VLCKGLADSEIQIDILSDKNLDMTLEHTMKFDENKKNGKDPLLLHTTEVVHISISKKAHH